VTSPPDVYSIKYIYVVSNLLSMFAYMLFVSSVFLFEEPIINCYNSDLEIYFRCSQTEACTKYNNYTIDISKSINNFISSYELLCEKENLTNKNIFTIISGVMVLSLMITGFFSDRYG
jgi:hypothetical protein